jgi:hypothetical protein
MQWVRPIVGRLTVCNDRYRSRIIAWEITLMSRLRIYLTATAVAAAISGNAMAQTPAAPPATPAAPAASSPDTSKPSTAAQVEKWTTKQWEAAKKTWAKDKKKWSGCRMQVKESKLSGRKSWSFLYKCMTN